MKTTRSWFCMHSRGENVKLHIKEKIGENPLLVLFFLVSQDLLVWQMLDMIQCTTFKNIFLKNASNLGHSNEDTIRPKKELFSNNVGGYNSG